MLAIAIIFLIIGALAFLAAIAYYFKNRYFATYEKSRVIEAFAIVGVVLIFSGFVIISSLNPVP